MGTYLTMKNYVIFGALVSGFFVSGCATLNNGHGSSGKMEPRISVITLGVSDIERSYRFYKEGLGFPTNMTPDGGIVVFATTGTRLSLYPYDKLAEDVGIEVSMSEMGKVKFVGITLAHVARKKEDVDRLLNLAKEAGGEIVKQAQDVFWGGYSGYFSDPDGYLWEVNYSDAFKFNSDGSIETE